MTAPEAEPTRSPQTRSSPQAPEAPEAPETPQAPTPTMHIGALAERTGMSLRTLRHYDETGLLEPSGRSDGGFRLYTDGDLARLLVIRRMKPLGFSLDEMADLLDVVDQLRAGAGAGDGTGAGVDTSTGAGRGTTDGDPPGDAADTDATDALRARLASYVESAEARRAELARKLDMADEFIGLLRST